MRSNGQSSSIELWHRRILGGIWAICALWPLAFAFRTAGWIDEWSDSRPWILAFIGVFYFGSSLGFIFGNVWARFLMFIVMLFTGIFFMFLTVGAIFYFWDPGLACLGFVVWILAWYTAAFELISHWRRFRMPENG
ncbi:MAG TPA: hypothetical protein VN048_08285 [Verrucomicrobiae bacterium]|jgi:hypothetical protein|nr:hypothetical protein [Verrucomicrobiae bacterium]